MFIFEISVYNGYMLITWTLIICFAFNWDPINGSPYLASKEGLAEVREQIIIVVWGDDFPTLV